MTWVRIPSPAPKMSGPRSSAVEHFLGKEEVTGSSPVVGSKLVTGRGMLSGREIEKRAALVIVWRHIVFVNPVIRTWANVGTLYVWRG